MPANCVDLSLIEVSPQVSAWATSLFSTNSDLESLSFLSVHPSLPKLGFNELVTSVRSVDLAQISQLKRIHSNTVYRQAHIRPEPSQQIGPALRQSTLLLFCDIYRGSVLHRRLQKCQLKAADGRLRPYHISTIHGSSSISVCLSARRYRAGECGCHLG